MFCFQAPLHFLLRFTTIPHRAILRGDKEEMFITRVFPASIFLFPWVYVLDDCDSVLTEINLT